MEIEEKIQEDGKRGRDGDRDGDTRTGRGWGEVMIDRQTDDR